VPEIAPGGLISQTKRRLPLEDRVLRLAPALFENDALCFLHAASTTLRFEAPNGAAIIVETEGFPHLALWSRPGNGFLCIEEWTGIATRKISSATFLASRRSSFHRLAAGCATPRASSTKMVADRQNDGLAEARKTDR
jgi:hypothetical protein